MDCVGSPGGQQSEAASSQINHSEVDQNRQEKCSWCCHHGRATATDYLTNSEQCWVVVDVSNKSMGGYVSGNAASYLADDCRLVADARERWLHSTESRTCVVTRPHSTFGDRAFAAAGPGLWNSLPPHLRDADLPYSRFRRSITTFLFGQRGYGAVWTILTAPSRNNLTYLLTWSMPVPSTFCLLPTVVECRDKQKMWPQQIHSYRDEQERSTRNASYSVACRCGLQSLSWEFCPDSVYWSGGRTTPETSVWLRSASESPVTVTTASTRNHSHSSNLRQGFHILFLAVYGNCNLK